MRHVRLSFCDYVDTYGAQLYYNGWPLHRITSIVYRGIDRSAEANIAPRSILTF